MPNNERSHRDQITGFPGKASGEEGDEEAGLLRAFVPDQPNALRWQAVQTGAEIAIVPPMLLLALGSALIWAFRGFR